VAGGLSAIDVENLTGDKSGAIEIKHRIHDIGHISHPAHGMERPQGLMRFARMHRSPDDSRRHGVYADYRERLGRRAQGSLCEKRKSGRNTAHRLVDKICHLAVRSDDLHCGWQDRFEEGVIFSFLTGLPDNANRFVVERADIDANRV
jgi:hypothetical protein